MNKKISTLALRAERSPAKLLLATAALALALLAIPHTSNAQGIIGGAERGSREGNRAAGPVGGVVGGAIGAGVGGVVGGVNGVLGVPDRGYRRGHRGPRCRGYYTRSGNYRCYR
ncbi:phage tail tape-measure protein [Rhodopseudomonas rhenobacensis]|uniref:Phage tail tape-measure protein n=1 Tax=Rhodopseudomonas rhenobacensis TaxID=87461 RepID=A0A7W7Z3Y3_9BRAD|nr:hypothetical protein [Rhodopseudomonas rhenobacensis]MBB5047202.1 phage tail tape-measure protein [Rhodopseudomonas rhenobacensis]